MFKKFLGVLLTVIFSFVPPSVFANNHAKTLQNLGDGEIMFAQGMIPHHEQAIEMSNFALKNSSSKKIKKLAKSIISAQGKEIKQMKYWLAAANASAKMDHEMHMSGMLSSKELIALSKLSGSKFDQAFLRAMIQHHKGAIEMLNLLEGSKNSEVIKLRNSIKSSQSAEIASMNAYLKK